MNEIEVKKDLYRNKTMAKFSHYEYGKLYYTVELEDGTYQFPIATVEDGPVSVREVYEEREENSKLVEELSKIKSPGVYTKTPITEVTYTKLLSSDLGTTPFYAEIRGSELSRWIAMAMKTNEDICYCGSGKKSKLCHGFKKLF